MYLFIYLFIYYLFIYLFIYWTIHCWTFYVLHSSRKNTSNFIFRLIYISRNIRPGKIKISLRIRAVWSESLLDAISIAKDTTFLDADKEDCSDCTDKLADLSLDAHVRR